MSSHFASRVATLSIAISATALLTSTVAGAEEPSAPASPTPQPAAAATPAEAPQKDSGNHPAPNSIYLEGLGAGLVYSLNYERMVADDVGVRVGFSYLSFGASASTPGGSASSSASFVTVPITASYIGVRGRKSSLELGGGVSLNYASASASGIGASASGSGLAPLGVAMVGYRLHPVDGPGFQFRVGLMALVGNGLGWSNPDPTKIGVLPWGYLSLGASF
jgi:hypothetical protein